MKDKTQMDDLNRYVMRRKKRDPEFARGYTEGYEKFKIGVLMKQARQEAGLTQEELARRIRTKKSAISRIENHAEDIKVSTLERAAIALGKRLQISLS
jgi:HTH-type transcriptional regulator/antitoxin HipB